MHLIRIDSTSFRRSPRRRRGSGLIRHRIKELFRLLRSRHQCRIGLWDLLGLRLTRSLRPVVPMLAKLQPITVQVLPSRADGPQRTANAAYSVSAGIESRCWQSYSRSSSQSGQIVPMVHREQRGFHRLSQVLPTLESFRRLPVAASMPSRADGPQSWRANLQVVHAAQPDAGKQQPVVGQSFPAIAPGSRRTAQTAYDILVPSRTDPGLPQPVIFPIYPSVAWSSKPAGPQRWLAHGSWVVQSPHEPGTQPIVQAQLPDRWRRAEWTAATAYQIANQSPHEAGKRPIAPLMPDQFRTPLRAATAAYFVANHGPGDPGKRPIAPSMPDVARGAIRAATYLVAVPARSHRRYCQLVVVSPSGQTVHVEHLSTHSRLLHQEIPVNDLFPRVYRMSPEDRSLPSTVHSRSRSREIPGGLRSGVM